MKISQMRCLDKKLALIAITFASIPQHKLYMFHHVEMRQLVQKGQVSRKMVIKELRSRKIIKRLEFSQDLKNESR